MMMLFKEVVNKVVAKQPVLIKSNKKGCRRFYPLEKAVESYNQLYKGVLKIKMVCKLSSANHSVSDSVLLQHLSQFLIQFFTNKLTAVIFPCGSTNTLYGMPSNW